MEISVATYTRNRENLLARVLESLCHQTVPLNMYEVVVVDNGSTDGTRTVVDRYKANFPKLRYFYEEKLGSSSARNRCWKEALGNYVAFIDDDGQAPPDWLEVAERVIRTQSPDVFGGPVYPFYLSPKPDWYKDEYATFTNGDKPRRLNTANEFFSGSNLFVRRSLLEQIGGFDESLGMFGGKIGYGEETAFLSLVRTKYPGSVLYYEPKLYEQHLVRPEKFLLSWQLRSRFQLGRQNYLAYSAGVHTLTFKHLLAFFLMPFLMIYQATLGVLLRNRSVYPYPQNYYVERVFHSLSTWGRHYQRLLSYFGTKVSK